MITWILTGLTVILMIVCIGLIIVVNNLTGLISGGVKAWIEGWSKR